MRSKNILLFLLIGALLSPSSALSQETKKKPRIAPTIPAAGAAGVTFLYTLAAAATAAAFIGVITTQANEEFQNEIEALVEKMKKATGADIEAIKTKAIFLYNKLLNKDESKPNEVSSEAASDADCKEEAKRLNPRNCCKDWIDRTQDGRNYESNGYMIVPSGDHSFQVLGSDGNPRCCLEWDSTHARFEIYTSGGDGKYPNEFESGEPYTHHGEFSCADDDESEDPCKADYPEKADNTGAHAPRAGCQGNAWNSAFRKQMRTFQHRDSNR